MRKYKTTGNTTLFDKEDKEWKFPDMDNPWECLSKAIDFNMFRVDLENVLLPKVRKSYAERSIADIR